MDPSLTHLKQFDQQSYFIPILPNLCLHNQVLVLHLPHAIAFHSDVSTPRCSGLAEDVAGMSERRLD